MNHTRQYEPTVLIVACCFLQPVTSSGPRGSTARPYQDLPVIQELGRMLSLADKGVRRSAPVADDSKKWLEWGEFLQVVRQLKAEAAGQNPLSFLCQGVESG